MAKRSNTRGVAPIALAAVFALAACGGGPATGAQPPGKASTAAATEPAKDAEEAGATASAPGDEPAGADAHEQKRARCVDAIEHVLALIEARGTTLTDAQRSEALGAGADECAADATRAELACVLATGALEEVKTCEGG